MKRIAGSAALVSALNVAFLLVLLVLYPVIAARFSPSDTDEFFIALALPGLVVSPLATVLATVLVPILAQCEREGREALESTFGAALGYSLAAAAAGALVLGLLAAPLLSLAAVWLTPQAAARVASLMPWLLPLVVLQTAHTVLVAAANCAGRYWLPGTTALASSLLLLGLLAVIDPGRGAQGIALAFVVCSAADLALFALLWPWRWMRIRPSFARAPALAELWRLSLPVGGGALILQGGVLLARLIAASAGPGAVTALDYAMRATWAITDTLSTGALQVVLTVWSKTATEGRHEELRAAFAGTMKLMLFLCAPVVAIGFALRGPVIDAWLIGASGGAEFRALVAATLGVLLFAVPVDVAERLYLRYLIAGRETRRLALLNACRVAAMAALSLAFVAGLGILAIALGETAGHVVALGGLAWMARRPEGIGLPGIGASLGRTLLASLAAWAGATLVPSAGGALVHLVVATLAGMLAFAAAAWLFGSAELRTAVRVVREGS